MIFPNTVTIFHPDYLSLVTLYPTGPESLRWTHRMRTTGEACLSSVVITISPTSP